VNTPLLRVSVEPLVACIRLVLVNPPPFGPRVIPADWFAVIVPLLVIVVCPNPICPAPCTNWLAPITRAVVFPP